MFRKFLKVAVLPALLGFFACSDDKTGGVTIDDNAVMAEGSSSSKAPDKIDVVIGENLWNGTVGDCKVKTDSDESGYWYIWSDDVDGGASRIEFPVAIGNDYSNDVYEPVIDECKGFCGTIEFGNTPNPEAGVGFLVADYGKTADISSWGGLCITYSSDVPLRISIVSELTDNSDIKSMPQIYLPSSLQADASESTITQCARWHDFSYSPQLSDTIFGDDVVVKAKAIVFAFIGSSSETKKFNIKVVGTYDESLPQISVQPEKGSAN